MSAYLRTYIHSAGILAAFTFYGKRTARKLPHSPK